MTDSPLDELLAKLSTGDEDAISEAFRTWEPYLRMVVRRRLSSDLRAKFDSLDVVQSVWVHALSGFRRAGWRFETADHLRAFLVRLTRNRLIDRYRRVRRSLEHERPLEDALAVASPSPQPGQSFDAEELWGRLLALCPLKHREILRQKRDGASADEVAKLTGLSVGSVRRILNTLAGRLARVDARQDPGAAAGVADAAANPEGAGEREPSGE